MAEICFKVGDSGGYRDGDILSIKPDGWLVLGGEMREWFGRGIEPSVLAGLPGYLQREARRVVARVGWKASHTALEIAQEYGLKKPDGKWDAEDGEHERLQAEADIARACAEGVDTHWPWKTLRAHGVVRVNALTLNDIAELTEHDFREDHIGHPTGKRRHQFRYWEHLAPPEVEALRNKALRVDVDREHALAKSAITDAPRTEHGLA
jgi:hypothetical protein